MVELDPWSAMLIWLGQSGAELGHMVALPFRLLAGL
jgi:hypothetical protein